MKSIESVLPLIPLFVSSGLRNLGRRIDVSNLFNFLAHRLATDLIHDFYGEL